MIAALKGKVIDLSLNRLIIDVNGVGYEVVVSPSFLSTLAIGSEAMLHIASVIREDSWTLYGFTDKRVKESFLELQSVSGVGPKVAYSITSALRPTELHDAIGSGDHRRLEEIPGVGKKMASRLILELKDRYSSAGRSSSSPWRSQVIEALLGLGFTRRDAEISIDGAQQNSDADFASLELAEVLRRSLSQTRAQSKA